jgi:hypothetical protein
MSEPAPSVFDRALPDDTLSATARRLRDCLEPIASNVYFSPEVNAAFEALGFGPGISEEGCLTLPELSGYFCSRAGCMGQVPGEVVVASFGVFSPALIVPLVERGWGIADRDAVLEARQRGATASLARILGERPGRQRATELLRRAAEAAPFGGRFLFAGLRSLPWPREPWGALWHAANLVREYRGDSHIAAWLAAGLDPVEAGLLTEAYYSMPSKRYHATRGWTDAELDQGLERLRERGLLAGDPPALTEAGRELRESIEVATDRQMAPLLAALGDDVEELVGILQPWAATVVAAGGFPAAVTQIPTAWGRLAG